MQRILTSNEAASVSASRGFISARILFRSTRVVGAAVEGFRGSLPCLVSVLGIDFDFSSWKGIVVAATASVGSLAGGGVP